MVGPMKKAQQKRRRPAGFGARAEIGDAARRHRLDRFEHHRSVATRARALSRRGGDRKPQRRRVGENRARARRALCRGRRAFGLPGIEVRAVRLRHRNCRRRRRFGRGGAAARRMGDGGDHRRGKSEADARRAERGATVALANKECLVCAGALFMRRAAAAAATILPVDSDTTRCSGNDVGPARGSRRVILTASGGPSRTWSLSKLAP